MRNRVFLFCLVFISFANLFSQAHDIRRGEAASADLYIQWAESAIQSGSWSEALIVLERGSDFANVSSDISYLLAVVRAHLGKPAGAVLEAVNRALSAGRWHRYTADMARLLEAEHLIITKSCEEALNALTLVESESPQLARLRMLALRYTRRTEEFLDFTLFVLGLYPRETEPVRIFLDYINREKPGQQPSGTERQIMDLILWRLEILLPKDPELAWMAAPYIRDTREAARLVAAYRAVNEPVLASLPAALSLGVIDERMAVAELFNPRNYSAGLDIDLLEKVWDNIRNTEGRDAFVKNLSGLTGSILRDKNRDSIPEEISVYLNGMLVSFVYDEDQDGLPELIIDFTGGNPAGAVISAAAEQNRGKPVLPVRDEDRRKIFLKWEKYPAVLEAELDREKFIPRPLNFNYMPVRLGDFAEMGSAGQGFPVPEKIMTAALTRYVLVANAWKIERPSSEFPGAVEVVDLSSSIPVLAREYLNGRIVSETDFLRGRPIAQRVDLDLDGRLETFRKFRRFSLA